MSQFAHSTTLPFASSRGRSAYAPASRRGVAGTFRRNQNTVKFTVGGQLGPVAHTVLVALMLVVLGAVYLTQVNKTGSYAYELNDLSNKRDALVSQKQDLEVENARLQALNTIQNSNVAKALTNPAQVTDVTQE